MVLSLEHIKIKYAINIIAIFLIIAILRLLPFNYYMSMLIGHDVVIDNKEGNAINFANYIGTGLLLIFTLIKIPTIKANWKETIPFILLGIIYVVNFIFAPYANSSWLLYQLIFIAIALLLHLFVAGQSHDYHKVLSQGAFSVFIALAFVFFAFTLIQLYTQFSVNYILSEYNDSFVNSLNSFGVMKQYYGYVAGFLLVFSLLIIKNPVYRIGFILLILFTAFGIRSFLIGVVGMILVYLTKRPLVLLLSVMGAGLFIFLNWEGWIQELLFDTRFYAYMNAFDILQNFTYGVGLGGYPVYTEINNADLFASFYNLEAALDYVPNSPESDLVHIFGSLGLVGGLIHLAIQLRLIFLGLFYKAKMYPFELCMFYYFVFMTFFGISEDTIFTISYWIFFGITSGVILSVRQREYRR